MRYDDPKLLESLAREYVIGTLHGRARRRFARVLSSSLVARRAVASWERQLVPLAASVRPVQPPVESWSRIETAIGRRKPGAPATFGGGWAALAAGFALVAILFGSLYFTQAPTVEQPTYVAVVTDDATGPVWLMQGFEQARSLRVTTVNPRPVPAGSSYELWMLPGGGAQPVSLGLIPDAGAATLTLTAAQLAVLGNTPTLAVSVEPAGGSPTGLPTGPVIYTAPLLRA
jgi:anti-sigma-K factor RskA